MVMQSYVLTHLTKTRIILAHTKLHMMNRSTRRKT